MRDEMAYYVGETLVWQKDDTRRVTDFYENGAVVRTDPYTAEENAAADARAGRAQEETNRRSIEEALADNLALLQTIIDTPNADMTTTAWKGYVKDLARSQRRLIRLVIRRLDGTA